MYWQIHSKPIENKKNIACLSCDVYFPSSFTFASFYIHDFSPKRSPNQTNTFTYIQLIHLLFQIKCRLSQHFHYFHILQYYFLFFSIFYLLKCYVSAYLSYFLFQCSYSRFSTISFNYKLYLIFINLKIWNSTICY